MYCPACGSYSEHQPVPTLAGTTKRLICTGCKLHFDTTLRTPLTVSVLVETIKEQGRIQAIKALRLETNWGLRESKQVIDMIADAAFPNGIPVKENQVRW